MSPEQLDKYNEFVNYLNNLDNDDDRQFAWDLITEDVINQLLSKKQDADLVTLQDQLSEIQGKIEVVQTQIAQVKSPPIKL